MDIFYIIVLSIAVILLIIILTYIGIQMTKNASSSSGSSAFPPKVSGCPDYWSSSTTDPSSCIIPKIGSVNTKGIYDANGNLMLNSSKTFGFNTTNNSINFADAGWTLGGISSTCSQKTWANQYGLMWDGISNFSGC
jgi:hypothetical protein